jgi:LmbE family N-acetylglucosaminyl deacetylase
MADRLIELLREAAAGVTVLSPHLDDAVFSCGALLGCLAGRQRIIVVSVFTAAAPPPWSWPARRALRALETTDAEELFGRRRAEDLEVLEELGVEAVHLGFADALFRRAAGDGRARGRGRGRGRPAYRTFRFDAARGRVASCDAGLAAEVGARSDQITRGRGAGVVLAPLAIGRHVDHLITRRAAAGLGLRTIYYSDFPYSRTAAPDLRFVRRAGLVPHRWLRGRAENARRIVGYRSQAGLFPGGTVPTWPEVYWVAASDSATAA